MEATQLNHELRRRSIELRLSNDRARLGVAKGQRERLTPEMIAAISEHYHYLIRGELLKSAARDLHRRLVEEAGLSRADPEYEAAYAAVGEGFAEDFLERAWDEEPPEGFRDALREYFAPGYTALEAALEQGAQADRDEPALFSGEEGAGPDPPPALAG